MPGPDRVNEVAEQLYGSSLSRSDVLTQEEESNIEFLEALDELVSECETCGTWVEAGTTDEDGVCEDCQ